VGKTGGGLRRLRVKISESRQHLKNYSAIYQASRTSFDITLNIPSRYQFFFGPALVIFFVITARTGSRP
jgi:hypothetical protein